MVGSNWVVLTIYAYLLYIHMLYNIGEATSQVKLVRPRPDLMPKIRHPYANKHTRNKKEKKSGEVFLWVREQF